jgi:hypothetical protein
MPKDIVKELKTPELRPLWQNAKKQAEAKAKTTKETDKYDALIKKIKGGDLGPDLEKWPGFYPNVETMKSEKTKLETAMETYAKAVKEIGLSKAVADLLKDAMSTIKDELHERMAKAEESLLSDEDLQVKLAVKESSKKQTPPLVLFKQDITAKVAAKAGAAVDVVNLDTVNLEVILSDPEVIKNVPADLDDALLAQEIRDAADFNRVVDELADAVKQAAVDVQQKQLSQQEVEKQLHAAADTIVQGDTDHLGVGQHIAVGSQE